jgi:two-component system, OmpR family, response regulator TctD
MSDVLVVEDEVIVAMYLRESLSDLGLKPHVFTEGKPALQALTTTSYSAAVLDLGLPDISGDEIVKCLLARDPNFRIVLTTGQDVEEVEKRFAGAHRVRVLSKPYDAPALEAELEKLGVLLAPPRRAAPMFESFADVLMTA